MDTWKQFEQNVITHSAAHHLMAIDTLVQRHGYARVSDVARQLEITRGSVSISLKPLKAAGLVEQDENKFLRLSAQGQHLVDILRARRFVINKFLVEVLRVSKEQAEIDGCKIEHLLSAETASRLTTMLRFLGSDDEAAEEFTRGLAEFDVACPRDMEECPCCEHECLLDLAGRRLSEQPNDEEAHAKPTGAVHTE